MNKILFVFIILFFSIESRAQNANDDAIQSCMNAETAKSAAIGSLIGGIFGAILGGNNDKSTGAAIGAGLGAATGGVFGWQSSWKSCTEKLNLVTIKSVRSEEYQQASTRHNYNGVGEILKIDGVKLDPLQVVGGGVLTSNFRFVYLRPDPIETPVEITRGLKCGNSDIPIQPESFSMTPGSYIQNVMVQIPRIDKSIGIQQCEMKITVMASGTRSDWTGRFNLIPN